MKRNLIISAIMLVATLAAVSQDLHSPYSRFGYGLLNDNATAAQRQMGGVGYAMHSGRQINVMNPASYAMADSLTFLFDMGLAFTNVWTKESDLKYHDLGGGLDYITMQFPIGHRMGMSVGVLPYSSIGYSFGSKIDNGSSSYEGAGGINQLYLGFAGRPWGGLSLGFNFGYLFGTSYHDVYATTQSASTSLFEQVLEVRDFHVDFGVQYSHKFGTHEVTAGVTYSPGKTLLGHTWIQKYDIGSDAAPDTLNYTRLKNNFSLPETWGAGVAYAWDDRLHAEIDFTYQPWSKAKIMRLENFVQNTFADRYRMAAGVSFMPSRRGNYLQRITYRLGGHYTRDYMMVDATHHVRDYGVSCGFGLPAPAARTVINVGFEWLHRATADKSILSENYFAIRLGVNFNQVWFMKSQLK